MTMSIEGRIAEELGVRERQVKAAVELLDGGSTVPFIARYRKEATEMLDDAQLRTLEERLRYLRELEDRRSAILDSVREQGKLDAELEARIAAADTKARLEDIYLPFKPKRRTKAQIAREAGLEPLAEGLLADPSAEPAAAAAAFVDAGKGVADPAAALEGARAILTEKFAEDADLIGDLRERMWGRGRLAAKVREGKEEAGAKFSDYFDFAEPFTALPSHRVLAMLRGEKEDVLSLDLEPEEPSDTPGPSTYEGVIARRFGIADRGRPKRQVARRHRPLGLAHQDPGAPRHRPAVPAARRRRGRGRTGLRRQPARPAARRPRRHACHARPGPGLPHRRQGGRRRRDRQGRRHR
ncbi:transcriptional accessory protein, partial [Streptomyces sp. C]